MFSAVRHVYSSFVFLSFFNTDLNMLLIIFSIIFIVARTAFWAVYYSGVGKVAGGPRTMCFVVGMIANVILVCACLYSLIF